MNRDELETYIKLKYNLPTQDDWASDGLLWSIVIKNYPETVADKLYLLWGKYVKTSSILYSKEINEIKHINKFNELLIQVLIENEIHNHE